MLDESDPSNNLCQTLWECFLAALNFGIRSSGGLGDMMRMTREGMRLERFLVDFLYFIVVLIVLLNVVFGIIIDTFGELREEKKERDVLTKEQCFICGIDKTVFDRAANVAGGFRQHIQTEHRMWHYLSFMVSLWEQDKDEDDGLEYYVRRCLECGDVSWFPSHQALCLVGQDNFADLETRITGLHDAVEKLGCTMVDKQAFSALKAELEQQMDNMQAMALKLHQATTTVTFEKQGSGCGVPPDSGSPSKPTQTSPHRRHPAPPFAKLAPLPSQRVSTNPSPSSSLLPEI